MAVAAAVMAIPAWSRANGFKVAASLRAIKVEAAIVQDLIIIKVRWKTSIAPFNVDEPVNR